MKPVSYTIEELAEHKSAGVPEAALANLRRTADSFLERKIIRVTEIPIPRPSGDLHDYISVSPYRWPNPDTPDGLPWVRRDGEFNPEVAKNPRANAVYNIVKTLALAAFYFEDKREEYASRAVLQIYDWFINPETRVNPNGKYAQSIPGVCEGCSPGIIDFSGNSALFDGMMILSSLGYLDDKTDDGVAEWFREFSNWLMTHDEIGIMEGYASDNHGAWYDEQILCPAIYSGRDALVRRVLRSSYAARTRLMIDREGRQPREMLRTNPIGYSFYALGALVQIAHIAERLGYGEYWSADEDRGYCILKKAIDYLYPFVKDPDSFHQFDINKGKHSRNMIKMLYVLDKRFPSEGYLEKAREIGDCPEMATEQWRLEPIL